MNRTQARAPFASRTCRKTAFLMWDRSGRVRVSSCRSRRNMGSICRSERIWCSSCRSRRIAYNASVSDLDESVACVAEALERTGLQTEQAEDMECDSCRKRKPSRHVFGVLLWNSPQVAQWTECMESTLTGGCHWRTPNKDVPPTS